MPDPASFLAALSWPVSGPRTSSRMLRRLLPLQTRRRLLQTFFPQSLRRLPPCRHAPDSASSGRPLGSLRETEDSECQPASVCRACLCPRSQCCGVYQGPIAPRCSSAHAQRLASATGRQCCLTVVRRHCQFHDYCHLCCRHHHLRLVLSLRSLALADLHHRHLCCLCPPLLVTSEIELNDLC